MEHQTTRNVILITEGSLQSSLLKDVLETKLGINVLLITPENLASPFVRNQSISAIVLDYSVITDEVFARYMEFKTPNLT
ncbi:helix-turn-helix transcriptional regulator, partial [Vibrio parahaemolyticus]